ncbi:MAG: VCBS repeat-containing protein [bacterium]|nr:VCBS repeat-containing protein [bacterium]
MRRPAAGVIALLSLSLLLAARATATAGDAPQASPGEVIHEDGFAPADLSWLPAADGVIAALPGTRLLTPPGAVQVPARHHLLVVPADRRVAAVTIEPLATHRERVPGKLARGGDVFTSTGQRLQAAEAPGDGWLAAASVHAWRGYQLVAVAVQPLLPAGDGACDFLDAYAVRVEWAATGDAPAILARERLVPGEAGETRRLLARLVDNPSALPGAARQDGLAVAAAEGGFVPDKTPSLAGSPVTCLIITSAALAPSFQVLADYRTARGMPTVVATREYIVANHRTGSDIQESIRYYIQDAYAKWGVEYVLLGGDSDILPPRIIYNSLYPANSYTAIPCDLYFACLDGNWNADGDENYGQPARYELPGDLVDFAEEVYVGRAPVSTPADAALFVQKVIGYESQPAGVAWTNRTLFAAEVLFPEAYHPGDTIFLDGASFAHEQYSSLIGSCTDMQALRMYETDALFPRDLPLTKASLVDSLNTGHYGIVNQIGHGYFFNMSVGDGSFTTVDADNLSNSGRHFLLYGLNCASAAFDNSCLMERLLQNPGGGAVATLGSAREAFPVAVNAYQQEFFSQLYCEGEHRVGRLVALSRLPFLAATVQNYLDRWTFENYTLLGDPALMLWSATPQALTVTAPTSIPLGQQTVNVTVTSGGAPVSGALVCLAKTGEALAWATTNASGQAALPVVLASAGSASLHVTGANLASHSTSIPVTVSGRYLKITSLPVVDNGSSGSIGNGNGIVDAGERIAFTPTYLNTGTSTATSLRGALSTTTPGVTVLTAEVVVSNAAAGAATSAQTPILVDFATGLPDGHPVEFRSDVRSGSTHWYSELEVSLNAPEPEVDTLDWQDVTWGNGNGTLDNGERVAVNVDLRNFGAGTTGTLSGRLRTQDPNVVLHDTLASWSPVGLLGNGRNATPFSLALTNAAGGGSAWLLVTDAQGRQLRHDFALGRPAAPAGLVTSTELGPDTIVLTWDPPAGPGILGYVIYRSDSAAGPWTRISRDVVERVCAYTDSGLPLLTPFHYRVATLDSSRVPSALSAVVSRSTAPGELAGFPAVFDGETSGPLAVGDIDGNGRPEIVLASNQVWAWHHDGTEVRNGDGQALTLGQFTAFPAGTLLELAAVTMHDLDGQAGKEFIVCQRNLGPQVHIYRADGSPLPGWPRPLNTATGTTFNWAAPAVGDIDGDGQPEIVVNTLNGMVWAWNVDGSEVRDGDSNPATQGILYVRAGATNEWSRSGPTLIDIDGDGASDIVFGTKNDATGIRRLMAIRHDGTDLTGFPRTVNGAVNCDISAGDLDGDGQPELVFFDNWRYLYAVRTNGSDYPGFPRLMPYTANGDPVTSPALADLDGDGWLEIIYTPNASGLSAKLVVVSTKTTDGTSGLVRPGWPVDLPGSSEASPVVGDLDGDGVPEIVQGIGGGDVGAPYNLYAFHADGQPMAGFPVTLTGPVRTSPVITDLDLDGDVDLVYAGWDFRCHVWDLPFAHHESKAFWPTYKGNMRRDGVLSSPGVSQVTGPAVPAVPLALDLPWPNPFNPSVSVRLYVDGGRDVRLTVHDLRGRRVRGLYEGRLAAGWRTVVWDGLDDSGRATASGVYFLRAEGAGAEAATRKLVLVR